jgi:hypothetical protein
VPLDYRDPELLEFLAVHRLALVDHLSVLLGDRDVATRHLGALVGSHLVRCERVMRFEPDCVQITRAGLASIRSELPAPEFEPRYRHDVGVAWMWLAARGGAWGPTERIMTEREMRSRDQRRFQGTGDDSRRDQTQSAAPLGIRFSDDDKGRLHYPDLLLIRGRRRVAVELQLAAPSPRRLRRILSGYGVDKRVSAILFAIVDPNVGNLVRSAAAEVDGPPAIHIQPAKFDDVTPYPVRPSVRHSAKWFRAVDNGRILPLVASLSLPAYPDAGGPHKACSVGRGGCGPSLAGLGRRVAREIPERFVTPGVRGTADSPAFAARLVARVRSGDA